MTRKLKCRDCVNRLPCIVGNKKTASVIELEDADIYCPNKYLRYDSRKDTPPQKNPFKTLEEYKLKNSGIVRRTECETMAVIEKNGDKIVGDYAKHITRHNQRAILYHTPDKIDKLVDADEDEKIWLHATDNTFTEAIDKPAYLNILREIKNRKYKIGHIQKEAPLIFRCDDKTIYLMGVLQNQSDNTRRYIRKSRETLKESQEKKRGG